MIREHRAIRTVFAAVMLVLAAVAAGLLLLDEAERPTVPGVVAAARASVVPDGPESVEGVAFPHWSRWGWRTIGARQDPMPDDRFAVTRVYRRGGERISYSIVTGTGNVDDETGKRTTYVGSGAGKVELDESGVPGAITVKRKRAGLTVVLAGTPPSDRLRRTMRRLAIRG